MRAMRFDGMSNEALRVSLAVAGVDLDAEALDPRELGRRPPPVGQGDGGEDHHEEPQDDGARFFAHRCESPTVPNARPRQKFADARPAGAGGRLW